MLDEDRGSAGLIKIIQRPAGVCHATMSVDNTPECVVSYPDSVRYLYSLGNELKAGAKFGIERMQTLLAELGNPERDQRFVHVAGTNGKGSTCAMIAARAYARSISKPGFILRRIWWNPPSGYG